MIPYGRQDVRREDIDAVVKVLKSDFLTQGPVVPQFEQAFCDYTGASHAVAVNSATSALHIACLALGLGEGDVLWTSPISFVASANCAVYCGAKVDFVDIDPRTFNLCPGALKAKLEIAEREGRLPKIVVLVHLGGSPCDMEPINILSKRYGFAIIEDASHAVGASYDGKKVGAGQFSDITVFSFHPVKIITSAEGGLALTNNEMLSRRMQLFRCHGVTREHSEMVDGSDGPWYYQQIALGYNFRLSDVHAALGLSQLARLDHYIKLRHELMDTYQSLLAEAPILFQAEIEKSISSLHLCLVQLPVPDRRLNVFEHMRNNGVGVNVHYIPIHLQPYYYDKGFRKGQYPNAESYYSRAITLPLHVGLMQKDVELITNHLIASL